MTFTKQDLTGGRVLVRGTDTNGTEDQVVLDGNQWADVKRRSAHMEATESFNETVEAFYAEITEAADKLEQTLQAPPVDKSSYVVFDEGEEPTPGRRPQVVNLSHDSIVLRLIEEGHDDRLVWVSGNLEVLALDTTFVSNGTTSTGDEQSD